MLVLEHRATHLLNNL